MDTAPLKSEVLEWIRELLPAQRYYIGLLPVINPDYVETTTTGVEAAKPDLFKGGLMAIYLPPGLPEEAIKLATDFSSLLGAEHMFIDPVELDSMLSATHLLPQLLAAAYINTTVNQPGWQDARKLTGRPYALLSGAMAVSAESSSLSSQAISTQEVLLQRLDALMENLERLRQFIATMDAEKLKQDLEYARVEREKWLSDRKAGNWAVREMGSHVELPTARQVFTRMFTFGGGRKPKPPK
jgi:prephenate dehydrogenase